MDRLLRERQNSLQTADPASREYISETSFRQVAAWFSGRCAARPIPLRPVPVQFACQSRRCLVQTNSTRGFGPRLALYVRELGLERKRPVRRLTTLTYGIILFQNEITAFQIEWIESAVKSEELALAELLDLSEGRFDLHGRRLVLHSSDAMAQLRKDLVETVGQEQARRLLTRFGILDRGTRR